jgi:hypothetical protein
MNESLNAGYDWKCHPQAAQLIDHLLRSVVEAIPEAANLELRMKAETGTRLVDWIDHVCLPASHNCIDQLSRGGYSAMQLGNETVWTHSGGMFPPIRVSDFSAMRISIKVDSVAEFLFAHRVGAEIDGGLISPLRMAKVWSAASREVGACDLWAIQRHGTRRFVACEATAEQSVLALAHGESFLRRKRDFDRDLDGFDHAGELIRAACDDLGVGWACDLYFAAERCYWQSRNRAARVQKSRQDRLGLGWANHDHHTYRSSRENFARLIALLEQLGFVCRERFYGGAQAGWGAQVLEQPSAGIVIFADVDLSPTEVTGDFAHSGLPTSGDLGTVGLWCKLHGEAMLQAGMHHLECQFDFAAARDQLAVDSIKTMQPFTDFDHLKQAFTEGEVWSIGANRIDLALTEGSITETQAEAFRESGAIGSHLEILQRDDGYKGFNQTGISEIIRNTDPRHAAGK